MKCCKLLVDGQFETLPFLRVIAVGYYDGPTEGFTECSQCGQAYTFRLLDWDNLQDLRVFAYSPLAINLSAIGDRLLVLPDGHASLSIVPPLEEDEEKFVKTLLNQNATRVAAFEGWPGRSSIWRDVTGVDLTNPRDWFSFLGIKQPGD